MVRFQGRRGECFAGPAAVGSGWRTPLGEVTASPARQLADSIEQLPNRRQAMRSPIYRRHPLQRNQAMRGIHHVTAIAGKPSRNLEFYSRTLGLRLVKKTVNFDDPGTYH